MPLITMEVAKLSINQKKRLISEFTKIASNITNIDPKAFYVHIHELNDENIGIGGLTLSDLKNNKN